MKDANENLHQAWQEQLVAYLYRECTGEEAAQFEEHLSACAECQRDVSEFSAVRGRLHSWQIEEYPHIRVEIKPAFLSSFAQLIRLLPAWGKVAAATAAALLVLAVFNVDVRFGGTEGFRFSAGILPAERLGDKNPASVVRTNPAERDEILAVVNKLIEESEKQQARELQAKLADLRSRLETNNNASLVKFTESLKRDQRMQLEQFRRSIAVNDLKYSDLFPATDSNIR